MLVDGEDFIAAIASGKVELTYNYSLQSSWIEEEIYTMAWVQDAGSKDVYNSGSSLDAQLVPTTTAYQGSIKIGPNPVQSILSLEFAESLTGTAEIFDLVGKMQKNAAFDTENTFQINMSDLIDGVYLLRIQSTKGILTRRILVKR